MVENLDVQKSSWCRIWSTCFYMLSIVDVGCLNMGQDLQDYGQHRSRSQRDHGFHMRSRFLLNRSWIPEWPEFHEIMDFMNSGIREFSKIKDSIWKRIPRQQGFHKDEDIWRDHGINVHAMVINAVPVQDFCEEVGFL